MILFEIFIVFLRIGLCAIGGAYSFLPLLQKEIVEKYHWLEKSEFLEVLGMVKIFPGAISIKFATYTGYKMAGIPGAIVANVANLLAPALLILFATYLYANHKNNLHVKNAFSTIQLAVFAMIIAVAFQSVNISQLTRPVSLIIVVVVFSLFMLTTIHPAFILLGVGAVGAFLIH
ncbi:hypothetical protein MNBD_BACTEROID05-373 [hydrothermal vent metagenome]|uniref:Chromate transport protein ChrA n=1 Tax=hydrothermal vent metagenome TaxID=652676 RepID=A0A3B0THL6_9ZZZZ